MGNLSRGVVGVVGLGTLTVLAMEQLGLRSSVRTMVVVCFFHHSCIFLSFSVQLKHTNFYI